MYNPRQFFYFLIITTALLSSCKSKKENLNETLHFDQLLCDYREDPLGIDHPNPKLTWIVNDSHPGNYQTAYQVLVADSQDQINRNSGNIWNSGKVHSGRSAQIEYDGQILDSGKKYYWKVRIWDRNNEISGFSKTATWETGLLYPDDWKAAWISAPVVFDWAKRDQQRKQLSKDAPPEKGEPAPIFRKVIKLNDNLQSARAYISGLGYYELYINGSKIGDKILDPAFTDYEKTVLYSTYDITALLKKGDNALGVMLGNGWYNMAARGVWSFDRAPWRADPALRLQIQLLYKNGNADIIKSDESWKCNPGPVTFNCIRQGEVYDARLEQDGWNETGFDDSEWFPVRRVRGPEGRMTAQAMPPIRIIKKLSPVSISRTPVNTWVCDFGQNMAGFAELKLNTRKGLDIKLVYGEKLYPDGTVDQRNIDRLVAEKPFQTDEYITRGGGPESWHPRFAYYGFRYVEISGFPDKPEPDNIKACVAHTDFAGKGTFTSSDSLLNSIQHNAVWSFVNNFHGYPTDCPHREKNGWTGDAQLASEMALFNFHVEPAYIKWVQDIVDEQKDSGIVPSIVPTGGWGYHWGNGPAWDYALIALPWHTYIYSGDYQMLAQNYPAMKKYIRFLGTTTNDNIIRWGLGDWVPARTETPPELITTAYYYHDAILLGKIADILKMTDDRKHYDSLAVEIRKSFINKFGNNREGLIGNGSQTSLGCALYFSLPDSAESALVLKKLVQNIRESDMNLDFGVLGAKFVPNALAEEGMTGTAYDMIHTTAYPGWGNWVSRGATTLWEDWAGESSRNHVFFGDVSAWFYKYLAGIRPDEKNPGFKHFIIAPFFPDDLDWAEGNIDTYYGRIKSHWERSGNQLKLKLTIPFNTSSTIILQKIKNLKIIPSGQHMPEETAPEIESADQTTRIKVLPGNYTLTFDKLQ